MKWNELKLNLGQAQIQLNCVWFKLMLNSFPDELCLLPGQVVMDGWIGSTGLVEIDIDGQILLDMHMY